MSSQVHPIPNLAEPQGKPLRDRAELTLRSLGDDHKDIEAIFKSLFPDDTRIIPEAQQLVFTLRQAIALFHYFFDTLAETTGWSAERKSNTSSGGIGISDTLLAKYKFINAYGLFVMSSYIVAAAEKRLRGKDEAQLAKIEIERTPLVVDGKPAVNVGLVVSMYAKAVNLETAQDTKLVHTLDDLYAVTRQYFRDIAEKAALECRKYADLVPLVENSTFSNEEFSVTGFTASERKQVKIVTWAPVQPTEVIGDQETTLTLLRTCDRLSLFDKELRRNPMLEFGGLIESVLVDGPPGTGKTKRIQMMMTRLAKRSEQVGIPYLFKSVTADQIKSEWYGKSAKLIAELLEAVKDPTVLALMFLDDIDLLLSGNRDSAGTNGADMDLMKALMDFFAGAGTNYIGNYAAIAATNKPTASDDALRQRFVYRALLRGPRTATEYTALVAQELRGFAKTGLLEIKPGGYDAKHHNPLPTSMADVYLPEMRRKYAKQKGATLEDIGKLCEELRGKDPKFTGRSVHNALQVAVAQAADFDIPEEWFEKPAVFRTQPWETRLAMIKSFFKPMTADHVMMALEHQFETERRYDLERRVKETVKLREDFMMRNRALKMIESGLTEEALTEELRGEVAMAA